MSTAKETKARAKADKAYAKANRPWYKKKRFWLLGLIALIIIIAALTSGGDDDADSNDATQDSNQEQPAAEEAPIEVTAQELIDALESNALAAANEYDGKRVTVTGNLNNVDASGDYFSLTGDDEFTFTNVQVYIDEGHLDTVSSLSMGQEVTVTGTVTGVGEVMGYSVDAETID